MVDEVAAPDAGSTGADAGAAGATGSPSVSSTAESLAAVETPASAAPTQAAAPASPWDAISDANVKSWVAAKGFPDVDKLATSAFHLEKLTGDLDSVMRLPKEQTPENMRPIWERLGAGKTTEDYKFPVPEGGDDSFAKEAASWMLEAGVPVSMANQLAEKWNAYAGNLMEQQAAGSAERDAAQLAEIKGEWGKNWEANAAIVDRTADTFGMTETQLQGLKQALGPGEALRFVLNIGSKMGVDDQFVSSNGVSRQFSAGGSPEAALGKIQELMRDKSFAARYNQGDASAREQMTRLHRAAYPEA